ncbi:MAG: hypothetical protein AABX93_03010 [Nanoarchaeota archaeon]
MFKNKKGQIWIIFVMILLVVTIVVGYSLKPTITGLTGKVILIEPMNEVTATIKGSLTGGVIEIDNKKPVILTDYLILIPSAIFILALAFLIIRFALNYKKTSDIKKK